MSAKVIQLPARPPVHSIDELLKHETPETLEFVLRGIIRFLVQELVRLQTKRRSAAIVKLCTADEPSHCCGSAAVS